MSILGFAQLTTARLKSVPQGQRGRITTSGTPQAPKDQRENGGSPDGPGVGKFVDALAALVPAEVLTLHALMITATTKLEAGKTTVSDPDVLTAAFFGLIALAMGFYAGARLLLKKWDRWDWLRMLLPAVAFVAWTMIQRSTAFDAVCDMKEAWRTVIALFLASILAAIATALAYKADGTDP